jgi:DNA-binding CsgD family transcriptional regulator
MCVDYHSLTGRQRRILELVASGKTNKEIAASLRISENTVEYHLTKRIYPLLGVRSRSAASAVYFKLAMRALRKSVVDARRAAITLSRRKVAMTYELKTIQSLAELKRYMRLPSPCWGCPRPNTHLNTMPSN